MSTRAKYLQNVLYAVLYWIALLLISGDVFITFLKDPGMNGYVRAQFDEMVNGIAYKPYVTRALVPDVVHFIVHALPENFRRKVNDYIVEYVNDIPQDVRNAIDRTKNPGMKNHSDFVTLWWDILAMYAIACALLYAFLLGFHFAIRYLFGSFFTGPRWFIDAVGLGAIALLPPFFVYYNYLYDIPTLFFFTLLLALMARRKWIPFLVVFLFACWNKETTILLTMVFALGFWGRREEIGRKAYGLLLSAQFLIYAVVRGLLAIRFWNNPGGVIEYHFVDHTLTLILLQLYSFGDIFVVLGMFLLLAYRWAEKPRFLKIALSMAVPLLLMATFFGFLDEYRAFYELYPVVVCLAAHTIGSILDLPLVPLSPAPMAVIGPSRSNRA
ncbi:MAG: hypothetical protein ABSC61_03975 [Anaerolineales bacterium]